MSFSQKLPGSWARLRPWVFRLGPLTLLGSSLLVACYDFERVYRACMDDASCGGQAGASSLSGGNGSSSGGSGISGGSSPTGGSSSGTGGEAAGSLSLLLNEMQINGGYVELIVQASGGASGALNLSAWELHLGDSPQVSCALPAIDLAAGAHLALYLDGTLVLDGATLTQTWTCASSNVNPVDLVLTSSSAIVDSMTIITFGAGLCRVPDGAVSVVGCPERTPGLSND